MTQVKRKILVSLFDHSGTWSQPYTDAGWTVVRVDSLIDPDSVSNCLGVEGDIMECSSLAIFGAIFMAEKLQHKGVISIREALDAYHIASSYLSSVQIATELKPHMVLPRQGFATGRSGTLTAPHRLI